MLKNNVSNKSSIIIEKLDSIGLSTTERAEALAALKRAESIVNSISTIFAATQRLRNRLFFKPSLGA